MKRVCFWADSYWIDEIHQQLSQTIDKICSDDNRVEFWLNACHDYLTEDAIQIISKLKNAFPQKELLITFIADPLQVAEVEITQSVLFKSKGFLPDIFDQIVYAPLFYGKCEQCERRFIQHHNKILRWMYRSCTDIVAYYYPNLPHERLHFTRMVLSHNSNLTVHHLYDEYTYQQIDELIKQLPPRKKYVIESLNCGKTYREIADEFGVTYNRVQQMSIDAERKIKWAWRDSLH